MSKIYLSFSELSKLWLWVAMVEYDLNGVFINLSHLFNGNMLSFRDIGLVNYFWRVTWRLSICAHKE